MSNIADNSQVPSKACWENAMIIHSGLRKEISTPCIAMHQAGSICEKQRENIICV